MPQRIEIEIPDKLLDPCIAQRMPLMLLPPWFLRGGTP